MSQQIPNGDSRVITALFDFAMEVDFDKLQKMSEFFNSTDVDEETKKIWFANVYIPSVRALNVSMIIAELAKLVVGELMKDIEKGQKEITVLEPLEGEEGEEEGGKGKKKGGGLAALLKAMAALTFCVASVISPNNTVGSVEGQLPDQTGLWRADLNPSTNPMQYVFEGVPATLAIKEFVKTYNSNIKIGFTDEPASGLLLLEAIENDDGSVTVPLTMDIGSLNAALDKAREKGLAAAANAWHPTNLVPNADAAAVLVSVAATTAASYAGVELPLVNDLLPSSQTVAATSVTAASAASIVNSNLGSTVTAAVGVAAVQGALDAFSSATRTTAGFLMPAAEAYNNLVVSLVGDLQASNRAHENLKRYFEVIKDGLNNLSETSKNEAQITTSASSTLPYGSPILDALSQWKTEGVVFDAAGKAAATVAAESAKLVVNNAPAILRALGGFTGGFANVILETFPQIINHGYHLSVFGSLFVFFIALILTKMRELTKKGPKASGGRTRKNKKTKKTKKNKKSNKRRKRNGKVTYKK